MLNLALTEERTASQPQPARTAHRESLANRPGHGTAARTREESSLIEKYLPLVRAVVGCILRSLPRQVDPQDLLSAGLIGLLDAIRHFDLRLGSQFESYARVRIRGAVYDELRRMDWVPRSVHRKARRVQLARQELEQRKRRAPTATEIAVELNLSLGDYHRLLDEIRPATFVCLDSALDPESSDSRPISEVLADPSQSDPHEAAARRDLAAQLAQSINRLPATQKKVLALYYYEDMRLREIAAVLGLTEARIWQIHAQAVTTLEARLNRQDFCQN
jgi:RNA polymerase sigma factor FliA